MMKAFIQPNGDVVACLSRGDYALGNLHTAAFFDVWSGPRHVDFIRRRGWGECSQCIESRFNANLSFLAASGSRRLTKAWVSDSAL